MRDFEVRPAPAAAACTRVTLRRGALAALAVDAPALLVTDDDLAATPWPDVVRAGLERSAGLVATTVLPAGEAHKAMAAVERAWRDWSAAGASRDCVVVAVGGGVVGDVAGFAAATWARGIPWVVVPTTVLAMADSSLGGKTGVNTAAGKNAVGALHHPRSVVADVTTLTTLPEAHWRGGWAEVVKAGAIGDAGLLDELDARAAAIAARDLDVAEALIHRSMQVKARVIEADAVEHSRREILNFGHTLAHALEHATRGALLHGPAVAIGMVAESRLGERAGWLPAGTADRIESTCQRLGLPARLPAGLPRADLVAALGADKKRRLGRLRVALPSELGRHEPQPGRVVAIDDLLAVLG